MAKRKSDNKFFTPRTVARGSETLDAYSKRRADKEAARNAIERAKRERFRLNCERGRRFLVNENVLEYWLTQAKIAMAGPRKYWGDTEKYSWPKDKAIVYAVMMICIEQHSIIRIIPDSLQQTKNYKFNEYVWTWVENLDLSDGFMNFIEKELKDLFPSESNTKTPDETPAAQRKQPLEMSRPLSLTQWKDILNVSINKVREWKNDPKSVYHFKKMSDRKWSLPLTELPAEYLEKYRKSLS